MQLLRGRQCLSTNPFSRRLITRRFCSIWFFCCQRRHGLFARFAEGLFVEDLLCLQSQRNSLRVRRTWCWPASRRQLSQASPAELGWCRHAIVIAASSVILVFTSTRSFCINVTWTSLESWMLEKLLVYTCCDWQLWAPVALVEATRTCRSVSVYVGGGTSKCLQSM